MQSDPASTLATAAAAAAKALAAGQKNPRHHVTLGWRAAETGAFDDAMRHFSAALDLAPHHPDALIGKARIHRLQGQLRDAVMACDAALSANPGDAEAWLERAYVLASGGSMVMARHSYERVVALAPNRAEGHAGLAAILARDGDSAVGRDHARRALALDPGNAVAAAALATMQLEAGEAAEAAALLTPLCAARAVEHPSADRALLRGQLGDALDRLGAVDQAFGCFTGAKADFAAIHSAQAAQRQPHHAFIAGIADQVRAIPRQTPSQAASPPPPREAKHLFVLGYPRSGNTLVENILASLPQVAALEERATTVDADLEFLAQPGGIARLYSADEASLTVYRDAYWQRVAQAGADVAGKTFVDMDPLKATRLPLIARLFPQARVLLMRRDPRDVVWSCFHTNFALTNAALDFTTPDRAARHYAAMMELIDLCLERLPIEAHVVRYEALVQDFDLTTQEICAFSGLLWSAELRSFDRTARRRGVSTASVGQVRKGLYDGSAQWRRYERHLQPILPILAPWVERFGYPP